jgi:S1-C subfamily serine protease/outer membrane protein assembly factor BamE (lipoprotein component of BamABCDE complex)
VHRKAAVEKVTRPANARCLVVDIGAVVLVLCLMLALPVVGTPAQPNQRKPVPSAPKSLSTADIFSRHVAAVVVIETFDGSGAPLGFGSGVILAAEGIVATNAHVLGDAASARVTAGGTAYDAQSVLYKNDASDVCILSFAARNLPMVRLAQILPRVGSRVVAIGNPRGFELTVSEGIVSSYRDFGTGDLVIQHTAPISPGSSGGALFDEHGELVGLTSATLSDAQNLNFAVSTQTLAQTLQQVRLNPHPVSLRDYYSSTFESAIAQTAHAAIENDLDPVSVANRLRQISALAAKAEAVDWSTSRGLVIHGAVAHLRSTADPATADYRQAILPLQAALKSQETLDSRWLRTARYFLAASLTQLLTKASHGPANPVATPEAVDLFPQTLEALTLFLRTSPPSLLFAEDDAREMRRSQGWVQWAQTNRARFDHPQAEDRPPSATQSIGRLDLTHVNIEGLSTEQVRAALGQPSLTRTESREVEVWYYDHTTGTRRIYFIGGKASEQAPNRAVSSKVGSSSSKSQSSKVTSGVHIEGYTSDQVLRVLGNPSLTQIGTDGGTTWYYDRAEGTLRVYFLNGKASLRRPR